MLRRLWNLLTLEIEVPFWLFGGLVFFAAVDTVQWIAGWF